jgi:hypothetical protein
MCCVWPCAILMSVRPNLQCGTASWVTKSGFGVSLAGSAARWCPRRRGRHCRHCRNGEMKADPGSARKALSAAGRGQPRPDQRCLSFRTTCACCSSLSCARERGKPRATGPGTRPAARRSEPTARRPETDRQGVAARPLVTCSQAVADRRLARHGPGRMIQAGPLPPSWRRSRPPRHLTGPSSRAAPGDAARREKPGAVRWRPHSAVGTSHGS